MIKLRQEWVQRALWTVIAMIDDAAGLVPVVPILAGSHFSHRFHSAPTNTEKLKKKICKRMA
jgi:hypothetical protein